MNTTIQKHISERRLGTPTIDVDIEVDDPDDERGLAIAQRIEAAVKDEMDAVSKEFHE